MKSLTTTTTATPVSLPSTYEGTFTPSLPVQQVTIGQFPAANPNWVRTIQVSDEAVYIRAVNAAVAISISDLINFALVVEPNLTWTPPVILTQPESTTTTTTVQASLVVEAGSEYNLTYAWYQSADGTNWSNALTTTSIALNKVTIASGGTGYAVNDVLTISGGTGTSATVKVLTVNAGVITSVQIVNSGAYSVAPSGTNSPTGGTGSSASLTIKFAAFDVATAGTLKVTPAAGDTGAVYYKVVVTDDASSPGSVTSDSVTLTTS